MEEVKDFNKEVKEEKGIVVVDFGAGWCGPCQMYSPVFEKVANEMKEIKFRKVDVDNQTPAAQTYGVMSVPTTIVFKDGEEIDRKSGYINEVELKQWVGGQA